MYSLRALRSTLLALTVVGLAACGGGDNGSESDGGGTPPPAGGGSGTTASVTLAWTKPTDARITGFRVYYGTSSRNYLQARGAGLNTGASAGYTVTNLVPGQTYYFAVTSYDASANESDYSAEVTKQVN